MRRTSINIKGKLGGKIVFFGPMRDVKPVEKPLFERRDDANLKTTTEYPVHVGGGGDGFAEFIQRAGISREGRDNSSPPNTPRESSFPAATAATTAVPAGRSSTTAAPASAGSLISESTPSHCPSS